MKQFLKCCTGLSLFVITLAAIVFADVPNMISYQGVLTDSGGSPVANGTYELTFRIYDQTITERWSEVNNVTTANGLFSVLLGSNGSPLTDAHLDYTECWLGITLTGDPEMTPQSQLVSSPFALQAKMAQEAQSALSVIDNAITSAKIINGEVTTDDLDDEAVTSLKIADTTIQFVDIGTNGAADGQVMKMVGGNWVAADDETEASSGRVHRDFLVWNATQSNPDNIHIKTNIHMSSNMHYRFLVEGYNYDGAQAINSEAVGYANSFADSITRFKNNNYDGGVSISQYRSSDGYVVIKLYAPISTYYLGFSVSAWFVNPTGPFDIEAVVYHQDGNL